MSCHLVSISRIFHGQLFHMKDFCAAFMCLQFGLVIFWRKDLGAKTVQKMLLKLTPGGKKCNGVFVKFQGAVCSHNELKISSAIVTDLHVARLRWLVKSGAQVHTKARSIYLPVYLNATR